MMSLSVIRSLNEDIAAKAANKGKKPYVPFLPFESSQFCRRLPNLGYYVPGGWERVEDEDGDPVQWFVDSTGCGLKSEPALTVEDFLDQVERYASANPGQGFAIVEEGQFQLYVGAFQKV